MHDFGQLQLLDSLSPPGGEAASAKELGTLLDLGSSVRIPEIRNVVLTPRIQAVVDHPAFQRLRKVRQLGPTHLVYPGAVHTRFEHSLGVFSCARWFVMSLLRHPSVRDSLSETDILSVLAAALLHDVGHYPFAHSLEALHLKGRDAPRHEDVGARILRGEIRASPHEEPLAKVLHRDWGLDVERVIALCRGFEPGEMPSSKDKLLRSVISGAIDADKMDYLERDSHHMGVPYGRHYDRARLIASLTLNHAEDGIALLAKGKVSAEMFVFSRYTMFSEAYWHHTVRSASAMVENALGAFQSRRDESFASLADTLLTMDDDRVLEWLHQQTPEKSATRYLVKGLIGYQRRLYKRILTLSRVYVEEDKRTAYDLVYQMNAAAVYDLTDRLRVRLSTLIGRPLHPADILIDTPPRDKDRLETIDVVFPDASGQTHYPLDALSRVVAGIQDDFAMVVKKIRIFTEPQLATELRKLDRQKVSERPAPASTKSAVSSARKSRRPRRPKAPTDHQNGPVPNARKGGVVEEAILEEILRT